MNIAARITELRAERTRLRAEAFNFLDSPGKWTECHNAAYKKDLAKLDELTNEIDKAIDTLLDISGCEASSTRIDDLRAERKKLEGYLDQFPSKLSKKQQKQYDDGLEKLQVVDKEVTRVVNVLIATQPPSGLLVL